jgi:hypothetical protein
MAIVRGQIYVQVIDPLPFPFHILSVCHSPALAYQSLPGRQLPCCLHHLLLDCSACLGFLKNTRHLDEGVGIRDGRAEYRRVGCGRGWQAWMG